MNHASATPSADRGAVLAIGFGTTVAMWGIAYFSRLFEQSVNSRAGVLVLLFTAAILLVACHVAGGYLAGRCTARGLRTAAAAGLVTGLVNLLAVASAFGGDRPNEIRPIAIAFIPGSVLAAVALGVLGGLLGRRHYRPDQPTPHWAGGLAAVTAVATFLLLGVGGFVTGYDEGLAVVDWPNTETYNMFLYPLERMTGGVFLEHAHRLFGSLVGLATLVLALQTQFTERRGGVRALAWLALLAVIAQGILGGLRVTGHFTLSAQPEDTTPSVLLAIVHGVFGQCVFGVLVALAVLRSHAWAAAGPPIAAPGAGTDRAFNRVLVLVLLVQLVLGALVRHFSWALQVLPYGLAARPEHLQAVGQWALTLHITIAVLASLVAVAVGVRAWGLYQNVTVLARLGSGLLGLVGLQIGLGIAALVVTGDDSPANKPGLLDVAITTGHQVVGAALLAWAVMLLLWSHRRVAPAPPAAAAAAPAHA